MVLLLSTCVTVCFAANADVKSSGRGIGNAGERISSLSWVLKRPGSDF